LQVDGDEDFVTDFFTESSVLTEFANEEESDFENE